MVMAKREPVWVIGWREWVGLPDLGVPAIKAKIDTGARSSALHAFHLERFRRGGKRMVRFEVHPLQDGPLGAVFAEAELIDERRIRSSNGHEELRPVIGMTISLLSKVWEIELTLTNRDEMGFRLLLGRQALRNHFLVDPMRSFRAGRP
ncbi:MAG: hypothetical protein ACI8V2_003307 [Candidatus Latescibacterota bacterium]|jgi:hypothetical protein